LAFHLQVIFAEYIHSDDRIRVNEHIDFSRVKRAEDKSHMIGFYAKLGKGGEYLWRGEINDSEQSTDNR
jgi:hypothetical protein